MPKKHSRKNHYKFILNNYNNLPINTAKKINADSHDNVETSISALDTIAYNEAPKQDKKDKGNLLAVLIPALLALLGTIFTMLGNLYIAHQQIELQRQTQTLDERQIFESFTTKTDIVNISYIEYRITSIPAIAGYHVRPYPYLMYADEEGDKIVPLKNLFTQEEYSADPYGICPLLCEDSVESLIDMIDSKKKDLFEVHYLLAIRYATDNQDQYQYLELKDGELTSVTSDYASQILWAYNNKDTFAIDMCNWPNIMSKSNVQSLLTLYS